ncbi:MAG TPA: ABC transporter permease [Acidimicrobiales bacterium]|nr:ABC transporter permease [Acidimicrobiales bacterium]
MDPPLTGEWSRGRLTVTAATAAGPNRAHRQDGWDQAKITKRKTWAPRLRGLLPLVMLLSVWELAGSPGSPFFPPPSTWGSALIGLWENGALVAAVVATLTTFCIGLGIATVLGAVLGLVVGGSPGADRAMSPTFEFARAMPPAAMVPIATLLLGYDETMKVTVVTLAAIWAILLNTRAGVRRIDQTLLDAARSLQLGTVQRIRKVIAPALLPAVFLGVRVAAPIAVVITLLVEILTHLEGVGALIAQSQRTFQPARVYALIVVAGALSLLVNGVLGVVESYVFRYRPGKAGRSE